MSPWASFFVTLHPSPRCNSAWYELVGSLVNVYSPSLFVVVEYGPAPTGVATVSTSVTLMPGTGFSPSFRTPSPLSSDQIRPVTVPAAAAFTRPASTEAFRPSRRGNTPDTPSFTSVFQDNSM